MEAGSREKATKLPGVRVSEDNVYNGSVSEDNVEPVSDNVGPVSEDNAGFLPGL